MDTSSSIYWPVRTSFATGADSLVEIRVLTVTSTRFAMRMELVLIPWLLLTTLLTVEWVGLWI